MSTVSPDVSIVIVNFNGKNYLESCIDSIIQNKYKKFELLVVDNGSTDGTRLLFENKYKGDTRIKVIYLGTNLGPSAARNIGVENTTGKYICFLDNDTVVDKNWLVESIKTFEMQKNIGACQCKLVLMDDPSKIDYAGDYLTKTGFLMQIFKAGDPVKNVPNHSYEIFAAKSAGMVVSRVAFTKAGGFDSDYFIYMEETDLCWRIWLAGYKIVFSPYSVIKHKFGTTNRLFPQFQTFLARFHGPKNYLLTIIKNLETKELLKILPVNILVWFGVAFHQIITMRVKSGLYVLSGILWIPLNLHKVISKRNYVQEHRRVNDKKIFRHIMRESSLWYFFSKYFSRSTVAGLKAINEK